MTHPNPNVRRVGDIDYERIVVRTHLIWFNEDIINILRKYALPKSCNGDWIAISEKVVSVTQNNVRHISTVKAGLLAKLITKGVKKYPNDLGWNNPTKMQLVVEIAGVPRTLLAMFLGGIGKAIGVRGIFWLIVSHRLAEIDGFNPIVMPPYNEYAALPPIDPEGVCRTIEDKVGLPAVIIDGNNINIKVIAMSQNMPVDKALVRLVLLDNPMGQGSELTPFVIVRRKG